MYKSSYFTDPIFTTDYQSLALSIFETYSPKTLIELGCGPGHLSRELAKLGVEVTAIDGFSKPDFTGYSVDFYSLDLNDSQAIDSLLTNKSFDVAVSVEVAEHLNPDSSIMLVNWLVKLAPIVIFSAAVPNQGGLGHINLKPREEWHNYFTKNHFVLVDSLREKLRLNKNLAPWYRFNIVDYIHSNHPEAPKSEEVIQRLLASDSATASAYYQKCDELHLTQAYLNYLPVKLYLRLRTIAKKILGKRGN